ncbi:nuclear transport factor 2 family protein [Bradyrhizobium sp. RT3a]|uniref:nuclear transport factor 2 family protein n=1 Tax=unclassified Bradyrhizobium TaxID=2631580 RepID=UPI003396B541
MSGTATNLGDYEAITKVVQHYLDGAKSGKGNDMKPAFHKDATIFGYVGPDLFAGPIQGLFDWNDQNGAATGIQARISEIDIVGTIANVRLEIDNWKGSRFTDMFTLLKTDGKWQIMNKVFHLHS